MSPLSREARDFRRQIIDVVWDADLAGYIGPDVLIGRCPVCGGWGLIVRFAGNAARAELECPAGCPGELITAAIRTATP